MQRLFSAEKDGATCLSVVSLFVPLSNPAAQGQSCDSIRCDERP
jgi:hypothetical protein